MKRSNKNAAKKKKMASIMSDEGVGQEGSCWSGVVVIGLVWVPPCYGTKMGWARPVSAFSWFLSHCDAPERRRPVRSSLVDPTAVLERCWRVGVSRRGEEAIAGPGRDDMNGSYVKGTGVTWGGWCECKSLDKY